MYFAFFKSTDKIYSFMTYQRVCNKNNTTGVTYGAPEFIPGSSCSIFNFLCYVSYRCLSFLLSFFVWPLHCLSFFDLWLLITPLVSSNFSCSCIWHNYLRVRFSHISRISIASQKICSYNVHIMCAVVILQYLKLQLLVQSVPITVWVRTPFMAKCTRCNILW